MQTTTILLVEHAKHRLNKLADALLHKGFDIQRETSDLQEIQGLDAQKIHMIILDLRRAHALSTCRKIRSGSLTHWIPLLCIGSGDAHSGFALSALEAGADRFCSRTQSTDNLIQQILMYTGAPQVLADFSPAFDNETPSHTAETSDTEIHTSAHAALARVLEQHASTEMQPAMPGYAPYDDPDGYDREYIRHMHQKMQMQDYFSLLDVDSNAPWPILYAALKRTAHAIEPERFSVALRHEAQDILQTMVQILKEARFVLSDTKRCAQYRAHLEPAPHPLKSVRQPFFAAHEMQRQKVS